MKARLHAQTLKAAADEKGGLAAEATVVAAEAMAALEEASKQAEDATASAEAGASGLHGEVNSAFSSFLMYFRFLWNFLYLNNAQP